MVLIAKSAGRTNDIGGEQCRKTGFDRNTNRANIRDGVDSGRCKFALWLGVNRLTSLPFARNRHGSHKLPCRFQAGRNDRPAPVQQGRAARTLNQANPGTRK